MRPPAPRPLSPNEVKKRQRQGDLIVDVREPEAFAQCHLAGSICVPPDVPMSALARALADRQLVLVTNRGEEWAAYQRCTHGGISRIGGYAVAIPRHEACRASRVPVIAASMLN
ncbi:MAG: rhodanese-like domain-containing protein, partial [Actinomycetota bacterium]